MPGHCTINQNNIRTHLPSQVACKLVRVTQCIHIQIRAGAKQPMSSRRAMLNGIPMDVGWCGCQSLSICTDGTGQARQTGVPFLPHSQLPLPSLTSADVSHQNSCTWLKTMTSQGYEDTRPLKVHECRPYLPDAESYYCTVQKGKVKDRTEDFSVEEWDGETGRHTAEKQARRESTHNIEIWRYIHTYTYNKLCYV